MQWWENAQQSLLQVLAEIGNYLPLLATAVAIMLLGWLVARLLRLALVKFGLAMNSVLGRI
ncbi:MAG: hypothetical protein R3305_06390, partial [Gammaproteobacteria bacterium]|nr:hypothetical protein [Gammaproteobacteria bacterium]